MGFVDHLLLSGLIFVPLARFPVALVATHGVLQFFEDHDALVVDWHAPADVNFL